MCFVRLDARAPHRPGAQVERVRPLVAGRAVRELERLANREPDRNLDMMLRLG